MKPKLQGRIELKDPWEPTPLTHAELHAAHALFRGEATSEQQLVIVRLMERVTGVSELEFRPSGERESNFAAGKRFVGLQFFTWPKTQIPRQG